MENDPEDPFPFCPTCATWHARGEHMSNVYGGYYRKKARMDFWRGWLWGAACTSGFLLVVRLFWVTG